MIPAQKSSSEIETLTGLDALGSRSAANHGFEQQRSVPSDAHFCEQFTSLLGGKIAKMIIFKY